MYTGPVRLIDTSLSITQQPFDVGTVCLFCWGLGFQLYRQTVGVVIIPSAGACWAEPISGITVVMYPSTQVSISRVLGLIMLLTWRHYW